MTKAPRRFGGFCWTNMITPSPAEAMAFFGHVLGWTFDEMPGLGHFEKAGGRPIGGLFDRDGPGSPPGTRPQIGELILVADIDATCGRIEALGGSAKPPFPVGDRGRLAVCADPNGSKFDIWEPGTFDGTDVDPTLPGAPAWFEARTTDVAVASAFYTDLFGWSTEARPIDGAPYVVVRIGDDPIGGILPISHEPADRRPHWAVHYAVGDLDEAAGRAVELGGTLDGESRDVPEIGRTQGITSPQGVGFHAIRLAR